VHIDKLKLSNFKNYFLADIDCSPKFNCLLGKNGMGKTNLLDAIHYLGLCKSHFSIPDAQLVKKEEDFFRLEAHLQRTSGNHKLVAKVQPSKKKKSFEKDGKTYDRLSDYLGQLPLIMIAPDDTIIGTGGSEERRKLIDETLCQTDRSYLTSLITYNKLLKQRNAALKQMAKQRSWDHHLLDTYDAQMIPLATLIFETRKKWVEPMYTSFANYYDRISQGAEMPEIRYKSQLHDADLTALFQEHRDKDILLQRTTLGIHKDDLVFYLKELPLKRFGSQGQLKSFIMALKLAQYSWLHKGVEEKPLLLLDDIFDKLDHYRVGDLLQLLSGEEFGQIFISDTDVERLPEILKKENLSALHFVVEQGTVTPKSV